MVQQVKALTAKPGDLNLIPRKHMVEEENRLPQAVSWPTHVSHDTGMLATSYEKNIIFVFKNESFLFRQKCLFRFQISPPKLKFQ